jgi:hypothetical protein
VLFLLFYHRIFAVTFDENFAAATGLRTNAYNLLIAVITAIIIVLAMNLVGSLLISALIIFPALSAMRLFRSFRAVIICSAVPAETDFNLEVEILRTGSSERTARMTYEHTMPLDIRAYENGFVLLCDNGLYFFDYEGHINKSTAFDGMTLASADIGDSTVAVAGQVNALGSENRIIVCSLYGTVLYDQTIEERISGITASVNPDDALAYTRAANSLTKILPDKTAEVHHPEPGEIIAVIARQKGALVCRESGAYIWVGNESDE